MKSIETSPRWKIDENTNTNSPLGSRKDNDDLSHLIGDYNLDRKKLK